MYQRLYDDNQIQGTLNGLGVWVAFITSCCLDFFDFFSSVITVTILAHLGGEREGGGGG